jgi:hypothetical protein
MNLGERDELLAVIRLIQMKEAGKALPILGKIQSVGFKGREYGSPPWSYDSGKPRLGMPESELVYAARAMGFQKAGRNDKADVYVNGFGVSIKSMRSAPPALVNHTARPGWVRICQQIRVPIEPLDEIIDDYWSLRQSGRIKEDIANTDSASPFRNKKEYLTPILSYFLFKGTGSRDSASPADYILDMTDPTRESTWELHSPAGIIDLLWPRLVFSLRSKKGMPPKYPNMRERAKQVSTARWTKLHQNEYRGALHVRAK